MPKYNMFDEFMNALHGTGCNTSDGLKYFFDKFESLPKKQVGNKFVTSCKVSDTHGEFHDSKVLDIVQDEVGNIIGLRNEVYDRAGHKLSVEKITPNRKSFTWLEDRDGIRSRREYDGGLSYINYNINGVEPL